MRTTSFVLAAALAAAVAAPSSAFAGATVFIGCWNTPSMCPKEEEPVKPSNTKTQWDVEVVKPDVGEYSNAGSKLAKSQSDDFVGGH